jgi:tRNA/rRNA methyltransferase
MLHFVLVEPAVPENVGAAARAIKTMGFSSLWIVNSGAHLEKPARILGHGSGDILDKVQTFADLASVRRRVDLLVGSSAKPRHHRALLLPPETLREQLRAKAGAVQEVALVFGREESGLHSDEIALCDLLTAIPMAVSYPSLNLAQAVMLYAYALAGLPASTPAGDAAPDQYEALKEKCQSLLELLGYRGHEKLHQWLMEHLPLLDRRDIGFAHHLADKIMGRLSVPENPSR